MVRLITILFFLVSSITLNAQTSGLLNGKWVFKKALNKEVDDAGRKQLQAEVINKFTFEFKSNGEFVGLVFGHDMNGKWTLSKNSKVILINSGRDKLELIILKLTETELILKLGLGEFLMKKV